MQRSFTDLAWLAEETEIRLEIVEPGFAWKTIIPPATTLYDAQFSWVDESGALLITDIGGQAEPGWDPVKGHGALFKLHRDNRVEWLVPYGATGRAMIMSSIVSPPDFGEYGNRPFPLGQLRPGRDGAHNTHAMYWVPSDAKWSEHYAVMPDAGSVNGGKSGALVSALTNTTGEMVCQGFGLPGTPEQGYLYVIAMFNCVLYKVNSKRQVWPYIVGDAKHSGVQFMPRSLYRAPKSWGPHAGKLICQGVANHNFATEAPQPGEELLKETAVYFTVEDQGVGQLAKINQIDGEKYPQVEIREWADTAPASWGPLAGSRFYTDIGTVNLMQTTMMPDGPLPYDAAIYRIDPQGKKHLFARNLQGGYPQVKFQGDRLVVASIGKSYSTGDFHYPDGYLLEIVKTK
ncbi:MAG: hypothetical protein ABW054_12395 [Casimicrobiaceae bacterium]